MIFGIFVLFAEPLAASHFSETIRGRILLDVEQDGEAWYVVPTDLERYYLARPKDAFTIMREVGLGISNVDLQKILPAVGVVSDVDTDGDGLADSMENALGTNPAKFDTDGDGYSDSQELELGFLPTGSGTWQQDSALVNRVKGKILLQVEEKGEAWYVYPVDGKRYYLGKPKDAFQIMRNLSLGITNQNLLHVPQATTSLKAPSSSVSSSDQSQSTEEPASEQKSEEQPAGQDIVVLQINAVEFFFSPSSSSVDVNKPLNITFVNNGNESHNLSIEELDIATPTIKPGEQAALKLGTRPSGTYTIYCSLPGHRGAGMEGTIQIDNSQPSSSTTPTEPSSSLPSSSPQPPSSSYNYSYY